MTHEHTKCLLINIGKEKNTATIMQLKQKSVYHRV